LSSANISLKTKITLLILLIVTSSFAVTLFVSAATLEKEKREDLTRVLTHACIESADEYLPPDANEDLRLEYLLDIPHNKQILFDSDADSIRFLISKSRPDLKEDEIAGFTTLQNGLTLSLISKTAKVKKGVKRYKQNLTYKYLLYLPIILAVSFLFLHLLMRPLSKLAQKCSKYEEEGGFDKKPFTSSREIIDLNRAFFELVERLEFLRKKEKELFRQNAHDLKTPLAIMKARIDVFKNGQNYDKDRFVDELERDMSRVLDELKGVLFFESSDFLRAQPQDVKKVAEELLRKMGVLGSSRGLEVSLDGESFVVNAPKNLFSKLISLLFENALTHSKEGGTIFVLLNAKNRNIKITNSKKGEKYLFSSKIGMKILDRLSKEIGFEYETDESGEEYRISLSFLPLEADKKGEF